MLIKWIYIWNDLFKKYFVFKYVNIVYIKGVLFKMFVGTQLQLILIYLSL